MLKSENDALQTTVKVLEDELAKTLEEQDQSQAALEEE